MSQLSNVLVGDIAATAGIRAVDHEDRARCKPAIGNDGMVARLGDAGKQPQHQRRIGVLHLSLDKLDRFAEGRVVAPDEDIIHPRPAERYLAAGQCRPRHGGRYGQCDRNPMHRTLRQNPIHLGTFESERKRKLNVEAAGGFLVDAISLVAIVAFCGVAAAYLGAF